MKTPKGMRRRCVFCQRTAVNGYTALVDGRNVFTGWVCTATKACEDRIAGRSTSYSRKTGRLITKPMDPSLHGTYAGARAHQRRGTRTCDPCLRAARVYDKERKRARKDTGQAA